MVPLPAGQDAYPSRYVLLEGALLCAVAMGYTGVAGISILELFSIGETLLTTWIPLCCMLLVYFDPNGPVWSACLGVGASWNVHKWKACILTGT